eukprot:Clim_evm44s55 gene=Clim_evmTU44s55
MSQVFPLAQNPVKPVVCHAWNGDFTKIAICPNTPTVQIFELKNGAWVLETELDKHTDIVTGMDWGKKNNKLITCSQDRDAHVWSPGEWNPTLVVLKFSRAATGVRWSPNEDKVAVTSASKQIGVCYYEEHNDWWVSRNVKKEIDSTVLCVDWHPNNWVIAAGSADFKVRIFSAYLKEREERPEKGEWGGGNFGSVLTEFSTGGWINEVSFSPDGTQLAWCTHDSSVTVVDAKKGLEAASATQTVRMPILPLNSIFFFSEDHIVGAGHDFQPYLLTSAAGKWQLTGKLDKTEQPKAASANSAMAKFKQMDSRGQERKDTEALTQHKNTVNEIRRYKKDQFSTVASDGKLVIWDSMSTLESKMERLKV